MSKIIVTHKHPDLDALVSIWLLKRFLSGWEEAEVQFVPAGETFRMAPPDDDPDILHVDTGLGHLDHHQTRTYTCASKLCLKKVLKSRDIKKTDKEALARMVEIVTEIDNGRDIGWPEAMSDRYEFMLHNILLIEEDNQFINNHLVVLDRVFQLLKNKAQAEKLIKEEGKVFNTRWGKSVAVPTGNDQVIYVGEKMGYAVVAKQDPSSGHLRVYARFDVKADLTKAYKDFKKKDPEATWYLHQSRALLLNGSRSNPGMKPTKLSLEEVIGILEKA